MNDIGIGNQLGMEKMKKMKSCFILASLMLSFILLMITGCGKKGPPIAPRIEPPASVNDLHGSAEEDILLLTWTIPERSSGVEGFIVYRSRTPVSEPECTTCPVLYERVIDIPLLEKDPEDLKDRTMTHTEVLERGYRYIYKVNPYMEGGRIGKDSNYFKMTFE